MTPTEYRFQFAEGIDAREVEQTLALSILAVGCLHGEAAVRADAAYAVDAARREVRVDGGTPTGHAVVRVFTGLCIHEYGERSFAVTRSAPEPAATAA